VINFLILFGYQLLEGSILPKALFDLGELCDVIDDQKYHSMSRIKVYSSTDGIEKKIIGGL
jgi:hypothetical protein